MNAAELKTALKALLKSNVTPLIVGHSGTGKTEITNQVAQEEGFDSVITIMIGQLSESGDLTGFPKITDDNKMIFCKPNFLPTTGKHLIFLDEINRVTDKSVFQAVFQLVNEGRIGDWIMPKDCKIVAAANPPTSEYTTFPIEEEQAFMDRVCAIIYNPSVQDWIDHTARKYGSRAEIAYINSHPEMLSADNTELSLDIMKIKPSPRSLERVIRLRMLFETLQISESLEKEIIAGIIGQTGVMSFYAWKETNYIKMSAEELVNSPSHEKIAALLKRQDAMTQLNNDLISYVKGFSGYLSFSQHVNIANYVQRLPGEFGFCLYKDISRYLSFNEINRDDNEKQGLLYRAGDVTHDSILEYIRKFKASAKKQEEVSSAGQ